QLGGVMSVIVHHAHPSHRAADLKAAIHAGEAGDGGTDQLQVAAQQQTDGDGGGGVEHVVQTGAGKPELAQVEAGGFAPHQVCRSGAQAKAEVRLQSSETNFGDVDFA